MFRNPENETAVLGDVEQTKELPDLDLYKSMLRLYKTLQTLPPPNTHKLKPCRQFKVGIEWKQLPEADESESTEEKSS